MQGEGWVHSARRGEEPRAADEKIRQIVGLAITVGHRVGGTLAHHGAAHDVHGSAIGMPRFTGARSLENFQALGDRRVPERHGFLARGVGHRGERNAQGIFAGAQGDAVFCQGLVLHHPRHGDDVPGGALHEIR